MRKVVITVEVDDEAMKAEDTLEGWCKYITDEYGMVTEENVTWDDVVAVIALQYFASGDSDWLIKSQNVTAR